MKGICFCWGNFGTIFLFVGSLDVDSLFTNIPSDETFDICTNTLFEITERVEGLTKIEFRELLSFAYKRVLFNS